MIEIAIALAVIAFALVAIIGVLPTGLTVQKDNREDTIINQDGPYWLETIRTGSKGLDHLTNYVETITINTLGPGVDDTIIYTNSPNAPQPVPYDGSMSNGQRIVGLLTTPKYFFDATFQRFTNTITARVRALTGAAVEQGIANPEFAFSYVLMPEIVPFSGVKFDYQSTNYCDPAILGDPAEVARRQAKWVEIKTRELNTSEIRLNFRWPLLAKENVAANVLTNRPGPNRQSFRAIASGEQKVTDGLTFFEPQSFTLAPPPPPCP